MQMLRNRLSQALLAVCLLAALAFGGVVALAVGNWWIPGGNTLTVVTDNKQLVGDLSKPVEEGGLALDVDIYKIANAEADEAYETFNYTLIAPFATTEMSAMLDMALDSDYDDGEHWNGGEHWNDAESKEYAAKTAWDILLEQKPSPVASGRMYVDGASAYASIPLEDDGLYLIVPHGSNVTEISAVANGMYGRYAFAPSLIAMPTKYNDGYESSSVLEGEISSAYPGGWQKQVRVGLKVSVEPLYGNLEIVKNVTEFRGDPVSFTFLVESTEHSPYVYREYVTVHLSEGTQAIGYAENIPAGTIVTVTENYEGPGYALVDSDSSPEKKFTIVSSESVAAGYAVMPSATFTNTPVDDTPGRGINNKYEWSEEDKEWHLVETTHASSIPNQADGK